MKRGDVGPFGVATLVLVLLVQALSLGALVANGVGPAGLMTATTVSRLVLPALCMRGVPAARADGLGRSVAGSVDPRRLVVAAVVGVALLVVPVLLLAGAGVAPGRSVAVVAGATVVTGAAVAALAGRAVRRFGGTTGDVLGAAVEVSFAATLLALVLAL
jgi:adenosylcobinamide-GDP ribazoletransferase